MAGMIKGLTRADVMVPKVQISLDLTNNAEALATAAIAVEAGVDWIEVGTPLVLAEGLHAVRALRKEFPNHPIVVDLKTMDGGYLEAEMMGDAGADAVVVMAQAHEATIEAVIAAGRKYDLLVMGDDMVKADRVAACVEMERLGIDMVVHHIGFDHRNAHPGPSPLDELAAIVAATTVPVQAVGGLSMEQAIECPKIGAPVVVFGAPLAIDGKSFAPGKDLANVLTAACAAVHATTTCYGAVA
ncbi:MAG: orotidine 5'-phosphate decarboxylase [Propionibacteriaceae bacterium]|jgi:3-hexulose-6-phosphate synthase/6-phospho-3-hexuloisomerase|nr:orotidine 5'-phosphate decarboxylase [Propionibacteriaceae bacterium]